MHADHSAFVLAGVWPQAADAIGVVDAKQFPVGTTVEIVAEEAAKVARDNRATVVFDSTNISAFAGVLMAGLPHPAVNWLVAAAITSALSHAAQPTPMPIAIGGPEERGSAMDAERERAGRDHRRRTRRQLAARCRRRRLGGLARGTLNNVAHGEGERLRVLFGTARPAGLREHHVEVALGRTAGFELELRLCAARLLWRLANCMHQDRNTEDRDDVSEQCSKNTERIARRFQHVATNPIVWPLR
jgi:hypothetical protein